MLDKGAIKKLVFTSLIFGMIVLTGCSKKAKKDDVGENQETSVMKQNEQDNQETTVTPTKPEDNDMNSPGDDTTVIGDNSEAEHLMKQAMIENLAANNVFHVNWYTTEGDFMAGTAFLLDSKAQKEKLLVTAFHFLCPENKDSITGKELPDYVLGGEIYHAITEEITSDTLKDCLIIKDAKAVPTIEKDVAAFSIQGDEDLKTLPISETDAKKGDKVYLLASLWDTDTPHEDGVYEGKVISNKDGVMKYKLDEAYSTKGASGAPIVNEYGEVVAIHMASSMNTLYAHSAQSFLTQIDQGSFAGKNYPNEFVGLEDEN